MLCSLSRAHTVSELKSLRITCQLSSTPRGLGWMTAAKLATSLRSVSAASASAARAAATSATANLQMSELMLLLPGNCCPTFRQNTCKCQCFVSTNLCLAK